MLSELKDLFAIWIAATVAAIDAIAPVSGKVLKLLPHAYVIVTPENVGILVHLGLDTVRLEYETGVVEVRLRAARLARRLRAAAAA